MKIINEDEFNIVDIKVFVCVPGAGKTYLAETDSNFVDIDRIRSNITYNRPLDFSVEEHEKLKGSNKNGDSESKKKNALHKIKEIICKSLEDNKIILCAPLPEVVDYINELNVPYALVFFDIKDNDLIKERLIARGNQEAFVKKNCDEIIAKMYYEMNLKDTRSKIKILLSGNEYLSDVYQLIKNKKL